MSSDHVSPPPTRPAATDTFGPDLVDVFGPSQADGGPELIQLLTPEGDLDRPAMGAIVFNDEAKRKQLEAIVHPLVFERYAEQEAATGPDDVVIHDIPLLAESGRADEFDEVVVVDAPEELQVRRMLEDRGWTEADARSRIGSQASREDRLAIASYVVDNTGSLEDLRARVVEIYEGLTAPAS